MRQSSANSRQGMHSAPGQILIPTPDLGFCASRLSALLITSIHNMNKYGDNGSPCQIVLVGLMNHVDSLLTNREHEIVVIHSMIHLMNLG